MCNCNKGNTTAPQNVTFRPPTQPRPVTTQGLPITTRGARQPPSPYYSIVRRR